MRKIPLNPFLPNTVIVKLAASGANYVAGGNFFTEKKTVDESSVNEIALKRRGSVKRRGSESRTFND